MPPPNLTAATAIDTTGVLPYAQSVDPESATNDLWYKYTAQGSDVVVGVYAPYPDPFSGHYNPGVVVWTGPNDASLAVHLGWGFNAFGLPIVVPVTPGETYWFQFTNSGSDPYTAGDTVDVSILPQPDEAVPDGAILINDDTHLFPATILDPTDGHVLKYVRLPAGERGATLNNGVFCLQDISADPNTLPADGGRGNRMKIFGPDFVQLADVAGLFEITDDEPPISSDREAVFYVVEQDSPASAVVRAVDQAGAISGTSWTLTSIVNVRAIAPSRDNTILYFSTFDFGTGVRRWDLVADEELSALTAGPGGVWEPIKDILVLSDGTIVTGYIHIDHPTESKIVHYDAAGSVLREWNYDSSADTYDPSLQMLNRLSHAADDSADEFWAWFFFPIDTSESFWEYKVGNRFRALRPSDGATVRTFDTDVFATGTGPDPFYINQGSRFGPSPSCPLIVLPIVVPPPGVVIDHTLECPCPCECDGEPGSSGPPPTATGPVAPPVNTAPTSGPPTVLDPLYWIQMCAGGGEVPTAADQAEYENWVRV